MNLYFGENIGNSSFRSWHTHMQTHAGTSQPSSSCRFITYNHTHMHLTCNQLIHHTCIQTTHIHNRSHPSHIQPHTSQPSHPSHIYSPSNEDVKRERRPEEEDRARGVGDVSSHIYEENKWIYVVKYVKREKKMRWGGGRGEQI